MDPLSEAEAPLRVLILEDTPADAELMIYELEKAGFASDPSIVDTRDAFTEQLSPDLDLILSDHALPQFNATDALKLVQQSDLDIPFIIVSGAISEEKAVEAMRQGAADFLLKDRMARLGEAVRNALRERDHRRAKERAMEVIRQSEALNRTILASLSEHVGFIDQTGRLVIVNEAWETFGSNHDHPPLERVGIGTNYLDVCRTAAAHGHVTAQQALTGIKRVLEGQRETFLLDYHYGRYWFEMHVTPLVGGAHGGAVIAHHDITEQKRAEEAERQAKEAAEEMSRIKSVFLTNMSHEIRTPLTAIIGFAEILSKQLDDQERIYAEGILQGGQRLTETLVSILTLTQLEASAAMDLRPLVIAAEVRKTVAVFQKRAHQKNLRLTVKVSPEALEARALVDASGLTSILHNLISNAIKFTDEGEISVAVEVAPSSTVPTGDTSEGVVIHVSDTGIGIDPAFLPHLFEPFLQESTGLTRAYEGSGLGLSIAYQIAEKMGGTLSVESEPGKGSRFTVRFPVYVEPSQAAGRPGIPTDRQEWAHKRVLVVDDDPTVRLLCERILAQTCHVETVPDAVMAISRARRAPQVYDALLVDINLKHELSGYDVLKAIRSMERYDRVPIVAVTAKALPGDQEQLLAAGFSEYLSKPFLAEDLITLVTSLFAAEKKSEDGPSQ